MNIIHRMRLLGGGLLLCLGCSSQVIGGEKTHEGAQADNTPPPDNPCTGGEIGDGMTCQDFSAFPSKEQLIDTCVQAGLQLQEISITTEGCPDNQWNKATYQCCPAPPPPPPGTCSGGELGDGATCQDYAVLKQQASDACQAESSALVDLKSDSTGCPDGQWSKATYTCCGPSPKPDPCTYSKVGDGATCQDASALAQQAADICAAAGLSVTATKLASDCPGGQSTWGEVACCPAGN